MIAIIAITSNMKDEVTAPQLTNTFT
jgi:hypothetical protein